MIDEVCFESSKARCRRCRRALWWRREHFHRVQDRAYDWRLVIWCSHCGAGATEEDYKAIRVEHDELVGKAIEKEQAINLSRHLRAHSADW